MAVLQPKTLLKNETPTSMSSCGFYEIVLNVYCLDQQQAAS